MRPGTPCQDEKHCARGSQCAPCHKAALSTPAKTYDDLQQCISQGINAEMVGTYLNQSINAPCRRQ